MLLMRKVNKHTTHFIFAGSVQMKNCIDQVVMNIKDFLSKYYNYKKKMKTDSKASPK